MLKICNHITNSGIMNKQKAAFIFFFSFSIHLHGFDTFEWLDASSWKKSVTTTAKNIKDSLASSSYMVFQDLGNLAYTETLVHLTQSAFSSLVHKIPFNLSRSKKASFLDPKIHASIYKKYINDFLETFLTGYD